MRHDPAIASIVIMLRELKMHGMAQAVAELAEQGAPAFEAAQPILSQLLKAETAEREVRSVAYQLKVAIRRSSAMRSISKRMASEMDNPIASSASAARSLVLVSMRART